ncbi:MAG: hypothetical protein P4L92_21065 [Rudaea sp.]|nr:hypothetical protein [Rudaea sp.]
MTNPNVGGTRMNKPSVTELYRRFADQAGVADAEQLAAQIAGSSARAQLLEFSRDLEPESAALSAGLAVALNEASGAAPHRRHAVSRRAIGGSRRWRGVAALAAAMVAAVVVWGGHRGNQPPPAAPVADSGSTADRIFAGFSESTLATAERRGAQDEIFRGEFRTDEIFNSSAKSHDG